jgi:hypothetical protein
MVFPNIVLGLILLVFGRKLFWIFVAIAGFLVGLEFTGLVLADQPRWIILSLSIAAGLLGALLAVVAQRVAFGLAGFYGGAYLALAAAQSMGAEGTRLLCFVLFGIIGAVVAVLIMDWAIIVLSSLVGAGAIVRALELRPTVGLIVFVALATAGCLVQAKFLERPAEG